MGFPAVKDCMAKTNMLANAMKLRKAASEKGVKSIHCPISFSDDFHEVSGTYGILKGVKGGKCFLKSSPASDFVKGMEPAKGDMVVSGKIGLCAFQSTNLDFILRQNSIKHVALCGFLTNCCVESTMRTAYELGYYVHTITDAC